MTRSIVPFLIAFRGVGNCSSRAYFLGLLTVRLEA